MQADASYYGVACDLLSPGVSFVWTYGQIFHDLPFGPFHCLIVFYIVAHFDQNRMFY